MARGNMVQKRKPKDITEGYIQKWQHKAATHTGNIFFAVRTGNSSELL